MSVQSLDHSFCLLLVLGGGFLRAEKILFLKANNYWHTTVCYCIISRVEDWTGKAMVAFSLFSLLAGEWGPPCRMRHLALRSSGTWVHERCQELPWYEEISAKPRCPSVTFISACVCCWAGESRSIIHIVPAVSSASNGMFKSLDPKSSL